MGRWTRADQAAKLAEVDGSDTQRQQARDVGVSRTTLQYWQQRQAKIAASRAAVEFFESPEGAAL